MVQTSHIRSWPGRLGAISIINPKPQGKVDRAARQCNSQKGITGRIEHLFTIGRKLRHRTSCEVVFTQSRLGILVQKICRTHTGKSYLRPKQSSVKLGGYFVTRVSTSCNVSSHFAAHFCSSPIGAREPPEPEVMTLYLHFPDNSVGYRELKSVSSPRRRG